MKGLINMKKSLALLAALIAALSLMTGCGTVPEISSNSHSSAESTSVNETETTGEESRVNTVSETSATEESQSNTESEISADETEDPEDSEAEATTQNAEGTYDEGDKYIGSWTDDRASMEVTYGDTAGRYVVTINWANSAFENYTWTYQCNYSESAAGLVSDKGTLSVSTYTQEGAEPEVNTTDGEQAVFYLENDGDGIRWENLAGATGNGKVFYASYMSE
ncbi:MAG: hypothetical protein ACI4J2_07015 [Ruminococcus sp.]